MSAEELNTFLAAQRVCRVATIGPDGPHATPLWFAWDRTHLWIYSITRSQRWVDLEADPRVSAVIDAGVDYFELHGVEITGRAEIVGDVPRTGAPDENLAGIEQIFAQKYMAQDGLFHDGRHAWMRITPTKIASWDFRKLVSL